MSNLSGQHETGPSQRPQTLPVGACPLCGGGRTGFLFRSGDRLHGTPGEFTYRRCESCHSVFQDPRVVAEDLAQCYPGDYFTHEWQNAEPGARRPLWSLRESLREIVVASVLGDPQPTPARALGRLLRISRRMRVQAFYGLETELIPPYRGMRALDVGCGSGSLLRRLALSGWDSEGVEWDPRAAAVARAVSGRPVYLGDYRRIDLGGPYDLIVLHHVLEHLDDPGEALTRIRELLAPGGRAVLFYPQPDSLGARIFGEHWFGWEVPRHLVLPSTRSIIQLARRGGFGVRARTTARGAVSITAKSRAYKAGRSSGFSVGIADVLIGLVESALVTLGVGVGEEAVIVLDVSSAAPAGE